MPCEVEHSLVKVSALFEYIGGDRPKLDGLGSEDIEDLRAAVLGAGHPFELRFHYPPRALEYGALRKAAFEYGPRGVLDADHVHFYSRATLQREVEAEGFSIARRRVTALPFEVVFETTRRSKVIRRLADFYYLLARAWPSMFACQHILEAKITTLDEDSIAGDPRPD
jgi:hypothetical protein